MGFGSTLLKGQYNAMRSGGEYNQEFALGTAFFVGALNGISGEIGPVFSNNISKIMD